MIPPLALAEAQRRLLDLVGPPTVERVTIERAFGRYLAAPLIAARTQPASDLSAMDGYAVRADDTAGPWLVVGESAAGHPYEGAALQVGQAIRISTGAVMPPGECAVLLQENAARDGNSLALNGEGTPTLRHIRRAGFDFQVGRTLLASGTYVGAAQTALALAAGHSELRVGRAPSLAILDSGDELALDPATCAPHQIPASNGPMLAALAAPLARKVERLGPVPDRLEVILETLAHCSEADVIVTSGGASVGDHDLIRPALEEWGASIDFWRVAMKPGKPLLVARKGHQWILGLPGNPVSSYVTAFLFLLPLLRKLGGAARPLPSSLTMRLGTNMPPVADRTELVRARMADGSLVPVDEQDSSALAAMASAEAFIERPAGAPGAHEGDLVRAYWLGNGGTA